MKRTIIALASLISLAPTLVRAEAVRVGDVLIPIDKAVPLTGDGAPLLLWVGLALLCLAGIAELRRRLS